jgi:hypothetical protein
MIEFALAIPFLLLIAVGILYFGRYYLISQTLLFAAQEGARIAARTPNLSDPDVRDSIRGFSVTGAQSNTNSVIYNALASARLLSQGNVGNMPPGSVVEILPWDSSGANDDVAPPGTIEVRIDYPFQLTANPFAPGSTQIQMVSIAMSFPGGGTPVQFANFPISQRAVAAEEIYQQNN